MYRYCVDFNGSYKFKLFRIGELIGKGNFATVHVAEWVTAKGESIQVAVKELVDNASLSDRIKFLQEAVIMGQFCHPHIVQLVGVSSANSKYVSTVLHICVPISSCVL